MSRFSQFFILSPRGDSILKKDFDGGVSNVSTDNFYTHVKFWKGKQQEAPSIFMVDGITYMYLKENGLHFVGTTRSNANGALMMELLSRLKKVFKDYCGVLTEESIRRNFILLYELLDEVLDFGYIQATSTETLKAFVLNEPSIKHPTAVQRRLIKGIKQHVNLNPKTKPSTAANKSIVVSKEDKKKGKKNYSRNEIFVDISESISVTFGANVCDIS